MAKAAKVAAAAAAVADAFCVFLYPLPCRRSWLFFSFPFFSFKLIKRDSSVDVNASVSVCVCACLGWKLDYGKRGKEEEGEEGNLVMLLPPPLLLVLLVISSCVFSHFFLSLFPLLHRFQPNWSACTRLVVHIWLAVFACQFYLFSFLSMYTVNEWNIKKYLKTNK